MTSDRLGFLIAVSVPLGTGVLAAAIAFIGTQAK